MRISDWSSDVCSSDLAIGPGKRNDIPALQHRFPAITGETHEQCADATFFRIGRSMMVFSGVHEFFVLGADLPLFGRFFALFKQRDQLIAAFDDGILTP